jgi:hypothetical protein
MLKVKKTGILVLIIGIALVFTFTALSMTGCGDGGGENGGGGGGSTPVAPTITTASLPNGTVGTAYNQTLAATGNTPITWSIEGTLPGGLSIVSATGVISGTPTTAGTSNFTVKATNTAGSGTKALSITITSGSSQGTAPTITTASLPGGTVNTQYSQILTATGDTPITWSLENGVPPTGLSLLGVGVISGMPTIAGTSTFTVRATNATGSNTKEFSITITGGSSQGTAPTITTASLPGGTVNTQYSQTLTATGDAPITWSIVDISALPAGLSLSGDVISGTPTTAGTYSFTVKAINDAGESTKSLSITIVGVAPTVTTASLQDGKVNTPYNQTLEATGDGTPITWSIDTGTLPDGLSIASTTGVISGTPTAAGTSNFTVKATNATGSGTKPLSITIVSAPTVTTTSLPNGTVNVAYSETLAATGDAPITWSLESGALPTGLNLFGGGVISGTPTTAGMYSFIVKATNAIGNDTKMLSITIASAGGQGTAPTITTASLTGGTAGTAYSQTLTATGDTPITWSITGALPAGLSLSGNVISGTPTAAGTSNFIVRATNATGSVTKTLSITIASAGSQEVPPAITTASLPNGMVNAAYSRTLSATGDTPITWSIDTGALPAGLNLSGNVISGTPTTAGTYSFTVKATNTVNSDTKALSITINDLPALTGIVSVDGTLQVGYSLIANISNLKGSGTVSYQWKRHNTLTGAGTDISGASSVSYTLTAEDQGKYISVTVTRADNLGSINSAVTAQVAAAPANTNSVAITITVSNGINNETVSFTSTGNITLPKNGNATVTVSGNYQAYRWFVDNIPNDEPSGILTLIGTDYTPGTSHRILVIVYKNGIPYSQEIKFTVGN